MLSLYFAIFFSLGLEKEEFFFRVISFDSLFKTSIRPARYLVV